MKEFISELNVPLSYDGKVRDYIYEEIAAKNIRAFLEKLQSEAKDVQHIVMFDEVTSDKNGHIFSECLDGIEEPVALIAVNPTAKEMTTEFDVNAPENDNVLAMRLLTKHRNAFHIANLLLHYIHRFHVIKENSAKMIPAERDYPLDSSRMAEGHVPVWIKLEETISDPLIEELKLTLINELKDEKNITFLHSRVTPLNEKIQILCEEQSWKIATYWDITGCEDDCVISLVEDGSASLKTFSRARKKLIIITL